MFNLFEPRDDFSYLLDNIGKDIQINNNSIRAVISSTNVNKENDDKYISTLEPINQGDSIFYDNQNWLIISEINGQRTVKYKGIMRKCNYTIKFNFQGNVKPFPSILETKLLDIESGQYMTLPVGKIIVTLQDNVDSRDIVLQQRFLIMGQAWKVVGIDKSENGLIILNCDKDLFSTNDDKVEEIADRWQWETVHNYVLTINNGDTATVNINDILTVNATVTDNGTTITNPDITYLSNDSNIVSVDNTGQAMGINLGTATITAQMTYNPDVKDTLQVTVQETPTEHNYSIVITGSATIKLNQTLSYTATFYDNGVEVTDQSGTWTIASPNPDGTTNIYATIQSQTGNSVSIKGTSNSSYVNKYFNLVCTLNSDSSITAVKQIQVKSLF